ncbi:MAG: hypothetical protein R6V58_04620 [Planctomycetota bacterium]
MDADGRRLPLIRALILALALGGGAAPALEPGRLEVQRKPVFEFAANPTVTRAGDRVTIRFKARDYCDATVAIEHTGGRILRHLASGVLGPNAPEPFQKNSLEQAVVWDGKDEIGRYVDDKANCVVRVSLGLRARMERTLFWSPHKNQSRSSCPIMRAAPEGVYVFSIGMNNQVRLFDHDGNYVRTVYPFPAAKMGTSPQDTRVEGLKWIRYPPDRRKLPSKLNGHDQDTFFRTYSFGDFVVGEGRIFLLGGRLCRLGKDGSTGGLPLMGPKIGIPGHNPDRGPTTALPGGAALSPDGRALYLAGYVYGWSKHGHAHKSWFHGVYQLDPTTDAEPTVFAGVMKKDKKGRGSDDEHFNMPADVACDSKGRVYVADHHNSRIQVFTPAGKLIKSIKTRWPAQLRIDPESGEIWVFSWPRVEYYYYDQTWSKGPTTLTRLGPLENPEVLARWPLPVKQNFGRGAYAEVDFHAETPTIWLANDGGRYINHRKSNIKLLRPDPSGRKLVAVRSFDKDAHRTVLRARPIRHGRQRLFVNPATGKVHLGEHTLYTAVACKSFYETPLIDPATGRITMVQLPTDPEDMDFDYEGRAYLRTFNAITRFDSNTWREIPYDYGEKRVVHHGQGGGGERKYRAISAITLPSAIGGMFHMGGVGVAPDGTVVVSCINPKHPAADSRIKEKNVAGNRGGKTYTPPIYPGRLRGWEVHVFDRHGKLWKADAAPGLNHTTMLRIDRERNVYALAAGAPYINGERYFNGRGCTLMKIVPGAMKGLTVKGIVPLPPAMRPKRPVDIARPGIWAEGAEWLFGPVGAEGHYGSGGHCSCYVNGNFDLDYYGRSFAPEIDRFRAVVLDENGNVIMRIGRYGNVDDGVPLVKPDADRRCKQGWQPPSPRSVGGDQVAIMHAQNVAVHTDRRFFLADVGNQCIRSIKLDYHTTETVPLKHAADGDH